MLMRVSVGIHGSDIEAVIETYNLMSEKWFTHASPTLFNSGCPRPQMSSCFLLAMASDSIEGIFDTLKQCASISKWAGGIGLHVSCIRASGSYIAGVNIYQIFRIKIVVVYRFLWAWPWPSSPSCVCLNYHGKFNLLFILQSFCFISDKWSFKWLSSYAASVQQCCPICWPRWKQETWIDCCLFGTMACRHLWVFRFEKEPWERRTGR